MTVTTCGIRLVIDEDRPDGLPLAKGDTLVCVRGAFPHLHHDSGTFRFRVVPTMPGMSLISPKEGS